MLKGSFSAGTCDGAGGAKTCSGGVSAGGAVRPCCIKYIRPMANPPTINVPVIYQYLLSCNLFVGAGKFRVVGAGGGAGVITGASVDSAIFCLNCVFFCLFHSASFLPCSIRLGFFSFFCYCFWNIYAGFASTGFISCCFLRSKNFFCWVYRIHIFDSKYFC